ncbi:MAG: DUF5050 domain-containing protein [Lachnospiraceae bacterium]|nr:DUF5050 domain-containing protein [Lachnospiraceae bacterium]
MSNKLKGLIVTVVLLLLFGGAVTASVIKTNSSKVPDGIIGNTPGNLNNKGLFCEYEGVVYFANPYDMNFLYSMTPEGTDIKRLCDTSVEYINAGGKYVFFYGKPNQTTTGLGSVVSKPGMYRADKKNGEHLKALTKDVSRSMVLVGNKMYYQHYTEKTGTTFAVMDLTKLESTELLDHMINPACCYQGGIFYNGMYKDHYLYRYDIATGTESVIWQGNIWNPIYDGSYVYYMDVLNDYRLCRYSITNNTIEILTEDRIDFFNLYGDIIYYQVSSQNEPALKRMRADGSEKATVANGVFTGINVTSTYTYFTEFGNDVPLYRTPTYGAPDVTEFTAARDAALNAYKPKKK